MNGVTADLINQVKYRGAMGIPGNKYIRLRDYDYAMNGYYFVTVCTDYGKAYLHDRQEIIKQGISSLERLEGVKLDYWVVMPDHVHMIIILEGDGKYPLGEVVRRFKAVTSRIAGVKLWQPNYYEHVIRNERALYKIREYIQNNPAKILKEFREFYR